MEKDIKDLKDGADFTSTQVDKQTTELTNAKAAIAKLTKTVNENEEGRKEMETKFLYLEAYSRRGNIKFMNIAVDSTEEREDVEETLRSFLGRDLGLLARCKNCRDTTSAPQWKRKRRWTSTHLGPLSEI